MNVDEHAGSDRAATRDVESAGYREYALHGALRPYVACFWSAVPGSAVSARVRRVLPDGCVDIIAECDGTATDISVVGTMTRALVVESRPRAHFIGVRFRPGVAGAILGVPACEVTDARVPLAELWRETESMTDGIVMAPSVARRLRELERMLVRRLRDVPVLTPAVQAAARTIFHANGNLSVAALAPTLGVTRQHLARTFARDVGISPKMLARVARMRAAVDRVRHGAAPAWSRLALDLGYYDQSHLVHELKELTGLTPGEWATVR